MGSLEECMLLNVPWRETPFWDRGTWRTKPQGVHIGHEGFPGSFKTLHNRLILSSRNASKLFKKKKLCIIFSHQYISFVLYPPTECPYLGHCETFCCSLEQPVHWTTTTKRYTEQYLRNGIFLSQFLFLYSRASQSVSIAPQAPENYKRGNR